MHTHTPNGVAVSAQKNGVLPISQQSMAVLASLGYHDYEGLAVNEDEKPRLVRDLGDRKFLMLRNHGLLTAAPSIADAFVAMYFLEASCMIQLRAQSGGSELIPIPKTILDGRQAALNKVTRGQPRGARPADRSSPSPPCGTPESPWRANSRSKGGLIGDPRGKVVRNRFVVYVHLHRRQRGRRHLLFDTFDNSAEKELSWVL